MFRTLLTPAALIVATMPLIVSGTIRAELPKDGAKPPFPKSQAGIRSNPSTNTLNLVVDAGQAAGTIRALHGGNSGPVSYGGLVDTSEAWKEIGFPLTRLHDCQWPEPAVVDIHTIFRDFRADPSDPSNYSFARTDDYIASILKTGTKILYRLGESIEHSQRKYDVHPPKDHEKWAQICLGIIRHYNEGWADGFHHNIEYWEIWNEPNLGPKMWSGTAADYYRLYETTAKAIKREFPKLKVGGPGAAGSIGTLTEGLLKHCQEHSVPLDFFSWHGYSNNPQDFATIARTVRQWLDSHGFSKTESHLDEWNYLPNNDWNTISFGTPVQMEQAYAEMCGPAGAAFIACTLMALQDAPLDMAFCYTAEPLPGFGLFSRLGRPQKSFYGIKAFRQLIDTPNRVYCSGSESGQLNIIGGLNESRTSLNVLVSNFRHPAAAMKLSVKGIPWSGKTRCEIIEIGQNADWKVTETREFSGSELKLTSDLSPASIRLIKLNHIPDN